MENCMNKPDIIEWTDEDILQEFQELKDKKAIAKRYLISVKEVTDILKRGGVL